jgi:hypothetical protein
VLRLRLTRAERRSSRPRRPSSGTWPNASSTGQPAVLVADLRQREILTSAADQRQQTLSRLLRNSRLAGLRTPRARWSAPERASIRPRHPRPPDRAADRPGPLATQLNQPQVPPHRLRCANDHRRRRGHTPLRQAAVHPAVNSGKRGYVCRTGSWLRVRSDPHRRRGLEEEIAARAWPPVIVNLRARLRSWRG